MGDAKTRFSIFGCECDNLSAAINSRKPRPTTAEAIKQAVVEEWDALTVDDYE
jgi:hypothetical protein